MVTINFQNKEIGIDLVYFGPPGSGKETWIRYMCPGNCYSLNMSLIL